MMSVVVIEIAESAPKNCINKSKMQKIRCDVCARVGVMQTLSPYWTGYQQLQLYHTSKQAKSSVANLRV